MLVKSFSGCGVMCMCVCACMLMHVCMWVHVCVHVYLLKHLLYEEWLLKWSNITCQSAYLGIGDLECSPQTWRIPSGLSGPTLTLPVELDVWGSQGCFHLDFMPLPSRPHLGSSEFPATLPRSASKVCVGLSREDLVTSIYPGLWWANEWMFSFKICFLVF